MDDERLPRDQSELHIVPSTRRKARLLVAYFSYTGNTERVAKALSERLRGTYDVETVEIVPTRKRSYLQWLAHSLAPGSEVEIENTEVELSGYNAVLLGFPKWTFSCPPLNRFVRKLRSVSSLKFFLFMTSGGFDDQRFLRSMTRKLTKIGCDVVESLTVRRKQIRTEAYGGSVDLFAKRIDEHMHERRKGFECFRSLCA